MFAFFWLIIYCDFEIFFCFVGPNYRVFLTHFTSKFPVVGGGGDQGIMGRRFTMRNQALFWLLAADTTVAAGAAAAAAKKRGKHFNFEKKRREPLIHLPKKGWIFTPEIKHCQKYQILKKVQNHTRFSGKKRKQKTKKCPLLQVQFEKQSTFSNHHYNIDVVLDFFLWRIALQYRGEGILPKRP